MSLRKREAVIFAVLTAAAAVGTLVSFFSGRPETSAPVFAGMEHYGQLAHFWYNNNGKYLCAFC